jgi:mannose-6-phosphate isomerase-like protein (cupin superfamily)
MSIVSKSNAEHYLWGEQCDGWHLVKTAGLSVIQERMPPRSKEVRHYHEYAEQFFFILSGTATMTLGDEVFVIQAGKGIYVPAGQAHQISNDGAEDLHFIVSSTPPSHGDRIPL